MNKVKILKNAERYVLHGKIPAAISEYQKIIEFDPHDLPILNIIGDLYVRLGKTKEGLSSFNKLANAYLDSGFKVKAIAIYKKITKLAPRATEARSRLAELYAIQGLMSEARAQYLQLADAYLAEGKLDQTSETLQKLLTTDPNNSDVVGKLVDVEVKRDNRPAAIDLLRTVAERMRRRGDIAAAKSLLSRAQEIDPHAEAVKLLFARILLGEGQVDSAIATLQELDPSGTSPEVQVALWECFLEAKKFAHAEKIARSLFEEDVAHFPLLLTLSEKLLTAEDPEQALAVLDPLMTSAAINVFAERLSQSLQKMVRAKPDYFAAIDGLVKVNRKLGQEILLASALEQLASYHIKRGNYRDAMITYEELLKVDPANSIVRQGYEKLKRQIYVGEAGERGGKSGPEKIAAPETVLEGHEPVAAEGLAGDFGEWMSTGSLGPEEEGQERAKASSETRELLEMESTLADEQDRELVNEWILEGELFSSYGLMKRAAQSFEEVLHLVPYHTVALKRLVELYPMLDRMADAAACCAKLSKVALKRGQADEAHQWTLKATQFDAAVQSKKIDLDFVPTFSPSRRTGEPQKGEPSSGSGEKRYDLMDELEAIPEAPMREEGSSAETAVEEDKGELEPSEKEFKDALLEIDFYIEQGFWAEAKAIIEQWLPHYPKSPSLLDRLERCQTPTPAVNPTETQTPAALMANEEHAAAGTSEVPTGTPQSLGDILSEFNIAESQIETSSDFNTHYNLGIAFREMGLLEEAIAEVQKAVSMLDRKERRNEYLSVCNLLGLCFVENGNPNEAIDWMERAMAQFEESEKGEEYFSLQYELANACQLAGKTERAIEIFRKIQSDLPEFRDVKQRIRLLQ